MGVRMLRNFLGNGITKCLCAETNTMVVTGQNSKTSYVCMSDHKSKYPTNILNYISMYVLL